MMRRYLSLIALAIAVVAVAAPAVAFAPPVPKVLLAAGESPASYWAYQDENGQWWLDGSASNFTGSGIAPYDTFPATSLEDCWVTIEYLDASDTVVGTSLTPVLAYVLGSYDVPAADYYAWFHAKQYPPVGAVPSKTRVHDSWTPGAVEKNFGYATAAEPGRIDAGWSTYSEGAGGRRVYDVTVTNTNAYNVSSVIVSGSERYRVSPGDARFLDTLYAPGPVFLAAGESASLQLSGHAETPGSYTREGPSGLFAEAKEAPALTVFRFYNVKTGAHFYTADPSERDSIISNLGWLYSLDGAAYTDLQKLSPNRVPLYRLYNKKTGNHFYTADINEKHHLLATYPATWSLDGEAYRVSLTPGSEPTVSTIWRFYNKSNGTHFYTADPTEKDNILATMGATYAWNGPAFYIAK